MLLARGSVTDRPWGQTLGALANKQLTGQITVVSDDKQYLIAFVNGAIVGATSPQVSDAGVRIALTNHLVSRAAVGELTRRIAAAPERDDVEVIIEAAQLTPQLADGLRRKVIAQRAARTFSLESGEFSIDDQITLPVHPGIELDVRPVIYLGARMNVSAPAMLEALRSFGDAYMLRSDAEASVARFELSEDVEQTVLAELRNGTSVPELEAAHREIDPRIVQALIYALMSVGAAVAQTAPAVPRAGTATITARQAAIQRPGPGGELTPTITARTLSRETPFVRNPSPSRPPEPSVARTPTSPQAIRREFDDGSATPAAIRASRGSTTPPTVASGTRSGPTPVAARTVTSTTPPLASGTQTRASTPRISATTPPLSSGTTNPPFGRAITGNPIVGRSPTIDPATGRTPTPGSPVIGRAPTPISVSVSRTTTLRKTKALIAARSILVEQNADHFALLGVPFDAPVESVRTAYLGLTSQLHPDKLQELGVEDTSAANRLFTQMGTAFAVLTDPQRRTEYMASLLRPDVALPPTPPRTKTSEELANEALEAFKRGESALRRDEPIEACLAFAKAVELQPQNVDYAALLGWAQFTAATDKMAASLKTRQALDKAIQKSDKPLRARFLLGRVERMLGRDREALYHFQQVVDQQPNHAEAASEIRAIEARQRMKR